MTTHGRCACARALWMHRSSPRPRGLSAKKRYNARGMTIIQVGVDYGTFIEASFCPQRTDRWQGEGGFLARVRGVSSARRVDVDTGRSARGLKLCVVQSAATMPPRYCTRNLIYLLRMARRNTLQGCNNSVDSPLRIQTRSERHGRIRRRERRI